MRQYIMGGLAVLLIVLVVVFSIQNRDNVDVSVLFWSMTLPKFLLILGTYVLGMLTGWGLFELIKWFWSKRAS